MTSDEVLRRFHLGPSEVIVSGAEAYAAAAAGVLASSLRDSARNRGAERDLSLALSGGSTPGPAYERLAAAEIPWERVSVFFADERAVPPDRAESNYALVYGSLIDHLPAEAAAVYRMEGEAENLEAAAARYERLLPERLDVLVLGVGADGHTASLFPGAPALEEAERRVAVGESPLPPYRRLTITPPVIRAAVRVFVLARGSEKAAAVCAALEEAGSVTECPARLARGRTWVLDPEAAAALLG